MLEPLISTLRRVSACVPATPEGISTLYDALLPELQRLSVEESALPWGRYLLHLEPGNRFNIQLDVFSEGYVGGLHAHETWGMFYVLRGTLGFWDYLEETSGAPILARHGLVPAGGGECFCPPQSDWHRVGAIQGLRSTGVLPVSVHIYGPGFNLETGLAWDTQGPRHYTRGPLGDLSRVLPALRRED